MEVSFTELKQKEVINLVDGAHLGRVCNVTFTFPENKVQGFTVTGCRGFKFSRQEVFIPIKSVVKIGQDAVLVKFGKEEPECPPPKAGRCPPPKCPPNNCPPNNYPPNNCPPSDYQANNCPPNMPQLGRRSLDEYE